MTIAHRGPAAITDGSPVAGIRNLVWQALCRARLERKHGERRASRRVPYPYLVRLVPVSADGRTPLAEPVVVVGKHLSECGLDFYHHQLLPYRRMIASFHVGKGRAVELLLDLTWCRFTKLGWYENGGRFLQALSPPEYDFLATAEPDSPDAEGDTGASAGESVSPGEALARGLPPFLMAAIRAADPPSGPFEHEPHCTNP
jgi:hypothetical protein